MSNTLLVSSGMNVSSEAVESVDQLVLYGGEMFSNTINSTGDQYFLIGEAWDTTVNGGSQLVNNGLSVNINNINISTAKKDLSEQEQFKILTDLSTNFKNTSIYFSTKLPGQTEYTSIPSSEGDVLSPSVNPSDPGGNISNKPDNLLSTMDSGYITQQIDKTVSTEPEYLLDYGLFGDYNISLPVYNPGSGYLISFHTWNQNGGVYLESGSQSDIEYWEYTPVYNGSKTYVGCTATATAQLLYYWGYYELTNNYRTTVSGMSFDSSDTYTTSSLGISIGTNYFTDINTELATIDYLFDPEEIAALSFGVGVKIYSDYGTGGTGAYLSYVAYLLYYNGFSDTTYSYNPSNSYLATEIQDDIGKGQVVLVGMVNSSGGGHAVLIDGYDSSNNTYHFNMGWGGSSDGWYSLTALPSSYTMITVLVHNVAPVLTSCGFTRLVSSGIVSNETVTSSTQTVLSGGATVGNIIGTEGVQTVYSGGVTTGTTVNTGGTVILSSGGVASSTTVNTGGIVILSSGGVASSTTINSGGGMHVYSNAVVSGTTVNQDAYLGVGLGATTYDTTIGYAGELTVWGGGVVNTNTINQCGVIILKSGAEANGTIINSQGGLHVYSGAVASNTTVNQGGFLGVGLGATTYDTTIGVAGELTVWGGGVVNTNVINQWGAIILNSGAVANATTINADGGLHIYSGATAYSTQINSGAGLGIGQGGMLYGCTEHYGATMTFYSGALIGCWNTFAGSVVVNGTLDVTGSYISLDVSNRSTSDGYILDVQGDLVGGSYSVQASSTQDTGTYKLGISVSEVFDGYGTVYVDGNDIGTLNMDTTLTYNQRVYDLFADGYGLCLEISSAVSQATASTAPGALSAYSGFISSDTALWTQNEYDDLAASDISGIYTSCGSITSGMLAG